jgi:S-formylglutathione hydrolase FrmB
VPHLVVSVRSETGELSRRGFLIGGLAGVAATLGCGAPPTNAANGTRAQGVQELQTTTAAPKEQTSIEQVHSTARGTTVQLITIRPTGVGGRLPTCLALHGRGGNAKMFLELGVPEMLDAAVAEGMKPFAVVSVDGGDNTYWVSSTPADDPQRMLHEEMPLWLGNRGFAVAPFAVMGISMGGYGALNYARTPGLARVAAISSAMFSSWTDAKTRNAFADEAHWQATEPLLNVATITSPEVGIWCGTNDAFVTQARQYVTKAQPKIAAIGPGGHDDAYWKRVLPDVIRFIGEAAAKPE